YAAATTLAAVYSNSGTTNVSHVLQIGKGSLAGSGTTILASGGALDLSIAHNRSVADTDTLVNNGTATWGPMGSASITIGPDALGSIGLAVDQQRPRRAGGEPRDIRGAERPAHERRRSVQEPRRPAQGDGCRRVDLGRVLPATGWRLAGRGERQLRVHRSVSSLGDDVRRVRG